MNKDVPCSVCGEPIFCKNLCRKHYGHQNREILLEQAKEYYKRNRENILARSKVRMKKLSIEQKQRLSIRRSLYYKQLRKNNINHKILESLRARINLALKRKNNIKTNHIYTLIGCSLLELKEHLQQQFKPGMNWLNHEKKGWHIDHKIPCSAFNLSKEDEQKKCFHYTNLQPLWWYENLEKSDKIINEKQIEVYV